MYETFEKLMKLKGVNASEVSRETGISRTFFSEWKNGKYNPKMDKLQKIAKYFGVPVSMFTEINFESNNKDYYEDAKTAILAQEMFEDKDMRTLFHIKKNIKPEQFKAHIDMIKALYKIEHPEEFPEEYTDE